jgi:hypothetical protein
MKKFFSIFTLVVIVTLMACQKDNDPKGLSNEAVKAPHTERAFMTQSEYDDLDSWQKEVANLINSSIGALDGMSVNNGNDVLNYQAEFTVHYPLQQKGDKGTLFYQVETILSTKPKQIESNNDKRITYHVTDRGFSKSCLDAIRAEANLHKCVNITVQRVLGGYDVTYEGVDNC